MVQQRNSRYLSCRIPQSMFDTLSTIASEDGISKSRLVRGLVAQRMISRIERRMILRSARSSRPCYSFANMTNRHYNRRR